MIVLVYDSVTVSYERGDSVSMIGVRCLLLVVTVMACKGFS